MIVSELQRPAPDVPERAAVEISRIQLCLSANGLNWLDEAEAGLEAVLDEFGDEPQLRNLLAEAEQALGGTSPGATTTPPPNTTDRHRHYGRHRSEGGLPRRAGPGALVEMRPSFLTMAIYMGVTETITKMVDTVGLDAIPILVRGYMAGYASMAWSELIASGVSFDPGPEGKPDFLTSYLLPDLPSS